MARLALLAVLFAAAACAAAAQPATAEAAPENPPGVGIKVSFRPSVVIVVGIFTMIFSLTFILLMYAKFCHPSSSSPLPNAPPVANVPRRGNEATQQAGVPKPVIESLPFFRFATLRGARQGMECSVCLARFDDADLLRLLPRCRHAFHLDCVDRWLESNASCPLCRTRVDAEAAALGLKYPSSARIVFGGDGLSNSDRFSGYTAGSGRDLLDIFVERVPSSRFLGSKAADEEEEPPHMVSPPELDRHKHRIIVSDVVFKSRWSELNSADLMALDTEMLRSMSSGRFFQSPEAEYNDEAKLSAAAEEEVDHVVLSIREETEKKLLLLGSKQGTTASSGGVSRGVGCSSSAAVDARSAYAAARMISSGVRSMSEIVSVPRRRERLVEEGDRRWLPIARRTARWFAGRANGEGVAAHV
ncbi:putative RING-H2 finger protein ATL12 [Phragmites australis]|uniref:putative RING-H2 finger protein ATL12 n=1 Tax=Phragmites australis TaxID=29695 RepID=UPI002D798AEC|nr:putative RING-H2 finger protein ATL12 [Phragmites australis]